MLDAHRFTGERSYQTFNEIVTSLEKPPLHTTELDVNSWEIDPISLSTQEAGRSRKNAAVILMAICSSQPISALL